MKKEEHCAVILYPGEKYVGHVVPRDGKGYILAEDLNSFTIERSFNVQSLINFVSDGCEKMVGWKTGVHASFEKIHGKAFGRIICIFHHLEKSFETIFHLYSGHTISPGEYSGDLGKDIQGDIHNLPLEEFGVIPNPSLLSLIDGISEETF